MKVYTNTLGQVLSMGGSIPATYPDMSASPVAKANMPWPWCFGAIGYCEKNGKVYAFGTQYAPLLSGIGKAGITSILVYDIAGNTWSTIQNSRMNTNGGSFMSSAVIWPHPTQNKLIIYPRIGNTVVHTYDLDTPTWTQVASYPATGPSTRYSFMYDNQCYSLSANDNGYLVKLNPSGYTWSTVKTFASAVYSDSTGHVADGSDLYFSNNASVMKYNLVTDTMTTVTNTGHGLGSGGMNPCQLCFISTIQGTKYLIHVNQMSTVNNRAMVRYLNLTTLVWNDMDLGAYQPRGLCGVVKLSETDYMFFGGCDGVMTGPIYDAVKIVKFA